MKQYELTVLYHPDLEMNIDPALEKVKKEIENDGGEVVNVSNEGKRKLAYPIAGQDFAVFYYYDVNLPADGPAKVSGAFNIMNEVIRYLLVTKDDKREKAAKEKAEREEKANETEEA